MQVLLVIPVSGLVAGAAFGLRWPDLPTAWLVAALCGWTLLAIHAGRVGRAALLGAAACGTFAVGGALLSAHAWHGAWRPPLRVIFETIASDERRALIDSGRHPPEDDAATMVLSGRLRADASPTAGGAVSLALDVEWVGRPGVPNGRTDADANPVRGGVLLTVLGTLAHDRIGAWRAGRRIRVPADLRRPARYLDPGVPDQERALARRGVTLVGTVKSGALVTVIARGTPAAEAAARVRMYARAAFADAIGRWSPRAAAIVTAIVIGDRTGLDEEVERRLQESGTYHVIAISGGNIALLAALMLGVFRIAGVLGRTAMLCAAAGLAVYGFVVQGGASVDRAVLMACVYFVGRAWDLRGPPFQSLVFVAGLLVLIDPLSVADPASLLTFGATAAIIAVPALSSSRVPRPLAPVVAMLTASVAVEAVLMPVAAAFFSRVTFAGLLLNFGAIPLMAVAQFAGMAVLPLWALAPRVAHIAGWVASAGAEGLVRTADLVAYMPWFTWRVSPPGWVAAVVYYLALMFAWALWRMRIAGASAPRSIWPAIVSATVAASAGLWIAIGGDTLVRGGGDDALHVTFMDVGQGDAALVVFPRGSSMLIDAGGLTGGATFDIGDRVVGPVLRDAGVRRLDLVALTHGDADHVGGAKSVLRDFRPTEVWEGVPVPPHMLLSALRTEATRQRARWTNVQRADATEIDGVKVLVHQPPVPDWERQDVRNDDSIVIELRWGDVSFVFTGDIGRDAERELAGVLTEAPLRVVKVPHHGSATSSSEPFVRELQPTIAVVSVGRSNNFGHPSAVVLDRYGAAGAAIFRTDQDGAVTVTTDGRTLEVSTFSGRSDHIGGAVRHARRHELHEEPWKVGSWD